MDDSVIQGLISLEPKSSQLFIEMHLIENAPHNYGSKKKYLGVAGNMVAFACKLSFELGFDGFVAFWAKSRLIDHYKKNLGAKPYRGSNRMIIAPEPAKVLVHSYYKNFFNGR